METLTDALSLKVAVSLTAHLQLLQVLVGRDGYRHWCGGRLPASKLGLARKFAEAYPILRSDTGRAYDRTKGKACVRFLAFPDGDAIAWWLISTAGLGGLADPASPDFKVAKDALRADGHITCQGYVLHFAHKKEANRVKDKRTGKVKTVLKNTSTWTWRMTDETFNAARAFIDKLAEHLEYGDDGLPEGKRRVFGLRGYLLTQRRRPMLSGVRTQVIELHRYAHSAWGAVRNQWRGKNAWAVKRYGTFAGRLMPLNTVMHEHLPKLGRIRVYGDAPKTLADLARGAPEAVPPRTSPLP